MELHVCHLYCDRMALLHKQGPLTLEVVAIRLCGISGTANETSVVVVVIVTKGDIDRVQDTIAT